MKRWLLACCIAPAVAAAHGQVWHFEARLDDEPIGEHRFELRGDGTARELRSQARFTVRLLGIPVYRYRHEAVEHWRGDCLQRLQAQTDDNGDRNQIRLQREDGGWQALGERRAEATDGWPDCLMSFAYWHPAVLKQGQLLNAQTGQLERVRVERLGEALLPVHGRPTPAVRWRLHTAQQPIDLWLAQTDGAWIGLDSIVAGGRKLSYRLR